ncbi:mechanosensitive ion channel family protein [Virgisporangium aliadipatigenens]|uniref:mechanosensitive ion channel family protein n=1 Tax=Virgisporangium aliadipatigenens TaxID=741659 RepID=UPI001EF163BA|nr:mechanosensitive ion channel domain-containing protein [Virgisporangium aliadipatigenens]
MLRSVLVPRAPSPSPSCVDAPELCGYIYNWTGLSWLAEGSYYLLLKPLRILMIILLAMLARFLIHRVITRVVRSAAGTHTLFNPIRSRIPGAVPPPTPGVAERRGARAEALGSILRSISSAVIFAVVVMLVLGELGVNLAPLLAGAGIAGLAIGFGAQNLVRDFLSGLFMLFEDQYGVGDVVDVGAVVGTVEAVGLRITTLRDAQGVLWYIRNGEILSVGNKSQGWALVIVDVPVGFTNVEQSAEVLRSAADALAHDEQWADDMIEPPSVLGVEQITPDGAVLRTTVKTPSEAQWRVARELRRRLTDSLQAAGIADRISAGRVYIRPPATGLPGATNGQAETGAGGAT